MLAGKKDVTPGSETQDFITHWQSSSQNFMFFCLNPPCPPIPWGQCQEPWWMPALQRKNTELGGIIIFMVNKSKPTLVPEGDITASHKVAALCKHNPEWWPRLSMPCILGIPRKNVQGHSGPMGLPLSTCTAKSLKTWISWASQRLWFPKKADDKEKDISIT